MAKFIIRRSGAQYTHGPFSLPQIKKLIAQQKIKITDEFSLDNGKSWHETKKLPAYLKKLEAKAEAAPNSPSEESPETSSAANTEKPENTNSGRKKKLGGISARNKRPGVSARSKMPGKSARKKVPGVSTRSKASARRNKGDSDSEDRNDNSPDVKQKKKSILRPILLLIILAIVAGGAYLHNQVSQEINLNADKLISAYIKNFNVDASYEVKTGLLLDKIVISNLKIANKDEGLDLQIEELRLDLNTLKGMAWLLKEYDDFTQPAVLNAEGKNFVGKFSNSGGNYSFSTLKARYEGSFVQNDSLVDSEFKDAKIFFTTDMEKNAKFKVLKSSDSLKIEQNEAEELIIDFSGPFRETVITKNDEEWIRIGPELFK
ncbi:MAG: hypothetical protein HQL32_17015 [Planctomycetes bacterium]|nr:hypothetical protein [Planctomycetota bacterium]